MTKAVCPGCDTDLSEGNRVMDANATFFESIGGDAHVEGHVTCPECDQILHFDAAIVSFQED